MNIKGEIMFEVKELGIEVKFKRGRGLHPRLGELRLLYQCFIGFYAPKNFCISGIAYLNPIDSNDKIIGKKIALQNAINKIPISINKSDRTLIWQAFWKWIKETHK